MDSKYVYPVAGHFITGNLKIISDSLIRSIRAKGPKYMFPAKKDFQRCNEKIAASFNEYCNRWCTREHVECDALKDWKLNSFKIIDRRISFYSQNKESIPTAKESIPTKEVTILPSEKPWYDSEIAGPRSAIGRAPDS